MYLVKLSKKDSGIITVDGISITHRWKRIEEKTKGLDELEKKGIIIIVERSKATRQMIEESGAPLTIGQAISRSSAAITAGAIKMKNQGFITQLTEAMRNQDYSQQMIEEMKLPKEFINEIPFKENVSQSQIMAKMEKIENKLEQILISPEKESKKPEKIPCNGPGKAENEIDLFLWLCEETHLETLYKELIDGKFLLKTLTYSEFKDHFSIGRPKKKAKIVKLQWMKTESRIVYLFDKLRLKQFIPDSRIFKGIENHFLNKAGKPFKHKQLSAIDGQNSVNEVKYQEIDNIIAKLEK